MSSESSRKQISSMLTAKPILSPCVKHEIEALRLSYDCRDCWYCCALQTVPLTPSSAVINTFEWERSNWRGHSSRSCRTKSERRAIRDQGVRVGEDGVEMGFMFVHYESACVDSS